MNFRIRDRQASLKIIPNLEDNRGFSDYFSKKTSHDHILTPVDHWTMRSSTQQCNITEKVSAECSPMHGVGKSSLVTRFLRTEISDLGNAQSLDTPKNNRKYLGEVQTKPIENVCEKEKLPCHGHQNIIDGVCSICNIKMNGLILRCPYCLHGGHREHIQKWFQTNEWCPVCITCKCFSDSK